MIYSYNEYTFAYYSMIFGCFLLMSPIFFGIVTVIIEGAKKWMQSLLR